MIVYLLLKDIYEGWTLMGTVVEGAFKSKKSALVKIPEHTKWEEKTKSWVTTFEWENPLISDPETRKKSTVTGAAYYYIKELELE